MLRYKKFIFPLAAVILFVLSILADKILFPEEKASVSFHFSGAGDSKDFVIEEANPMEKSASDDWWLNSGGIMLVEKDTFSTNLGEMDKDDKWRKIYKKNNSRDTDRGYHPQNIFRLVSQNKWKNFTQQLYFNIDAINSSDSSYRNDSNGVLLFNRYQDGDNLYYTGLRVDGHAVIKKKIDGKYYTMGEKSIFKSRNSYDRKENPNILPIHSWVGIKSEVRSVGDEVDIKLYIDKEQKGDWQLVLEIQDKEDKYGKAPFFQEGFGGIRTDFMDVSFKDYNIDESRP